MLVALAVLGVTGAALVYALLWTATVFVPWLFAAAAADDAATLDFALPAAIGPVQFAGVTALAFALVAVASYRHLDGSVETEPLADADAPDLYARVRRLAAAMDAPEPTVERVRSPLPNTLAVVRPTGSAIVVTDGLLETLDGAALDAVLAHELAHLRNRDATVMFAASLVFVASRSALRAALAVCARSPVYGVLLLGPALVACAVIQVPAIVVFGLLSQYREYAADAAAVAATGDPGALAAALRRLDEQVATLPRGDLRAQDSGFRALCLLPHGIPVTTEQPDSDADEAESIDWTDPESVRELYEDQPMKRLERTGRDDSWSVFGTGNGTEVGSGTDLARLGEVLLADPWDRLRTDRRTAGDGNSKSTDIDPEFGNWERVDRLERELGDQPMQDDGPADGSGSAGRGLLSTFWYRFVEPLGDLVSMLAPKRWTPAPHPPTERRIERLRDRAAALERDR